MPKPDPISISRATNSASAVCTVSISMPVTLASTDACGSASAITVPPAALASLLPMSEMRVSSFCASRPEASSAESLWNCWQYSRADLPFTSVHSLGHEPEPLRLVHVEFGCDGLRAADAPGSR